jgi:xanthine dehydrogenase accessory factor
VGIYRELFERLKEPKSLLLLSEGEGGKVKYRIFYPEQEDLPALVSEAWDTKRLIWKWDQSGDWQKAEAFHPPVKLYLLGGGHISSALAEIAALVDISVVVLEDRPEFANRQRFPKAEQIICDDFIPALSRINFNPSSFVVAATRGHRYDQQCLEFLLKKRLAYIGMVGSKRRVRILKRNFQEMGITDEQLNNLHSPIGININANTPAEIAVSIMAEIIQVKRTLFPAEETDREVLEGLYAIELSGERAVLVTIVNTKGSSPRKTGARMLIYPDGRVVGTIGGGCGEAEVKREALNVFDHDKAIIYRLDMTAEAAADEGMACGGIMQALLEPIGGKRK